MLQINDRVHYRTKGGGVHSVLGTVTKVKDGGYTVEWDDVDYTKYTAQSQYKDEDLIRAE